MYNNTIHVSYASCECKYVHHAWCDYAFCGVCFYSLWRLIRFENNVLLSNLIFFSAVQSKNIHSSLLQNSDAQKQDGGLPSQTYMIMIMIKCNDVCPISEGSVVSPWHNPWSLLYASSSPVFSGKSSLNYIPVSSLLQRLDLFHVRSLQSFTRTYFVMLTMNNSLSKCKKCFGNVEKTLIHRVGLNQHLSQCLAQ